MNILENIKKIIYLFSFFVVLILLSSSYIMNEKYKIIWNMELNKENIISIINQYWQNNKILFLILIFIILINIINLLKYSKKFKIVEKLTNIVNIIFIGSIIRNVIIIESIIIKNIINFEETLYKNYFIEIIRIFTENELWFLVNNYLASKKLDPYLLDIITNKIKEQHIINPNDRLSIIYQKIDALIYNEINAINNITTLKGLNYQIIKYVNVIQDFLLTHPLLILTGGIVLGGIIFYMNYRIQNINLIKLSNGYTRHAQDSIDNIYHDLKIHARAIEYACNLFNSRYSNLLEREQIILQHITRLIEIDKFIVKRLAPILINFSDEDAEIEIIKKFAEEISELPLLT